MRPRLPTNSQCHQFIQLIEDTKEREVQRYLIRSFQSFKDGHLEAAIVLAWAGVERYYALVRDSIGQWYFEQQYKKANNDREPPNLRVAILDGISFRSQVFNNFKTDPENPQSNTHHKSLEMLRHDVAHGSGKFCRNTNEVLEAIMTIRFVIVRTVNDEKFHDIEKVVNFLIEAQLPSRIDGLLKHFPGDMDWMPVCFKLNGAFLNRTKAQPESTKVFANCIFRNLTPDKQLLAWENYAHHALTCLKNPLYNLRSRPGIYSFLPRPASSQVFDLRDQFLEYYFDWLERQIDLALKEARLLENDASRLEDELDRLSGIIDDMIRKISRDVPDHLQEKWNRIQTKWRS